MKSLELKIPPPIVVVITGALMWLTAKVTFSFDAPFVLRLSALITMSLLGEGIGIAGIRAFIRAKTTINPLKPTASSALVSGGVYRYTRNPMYLGMLITLVGWSLFLASPVSLLFLPAFAWYIGRFQIAPEERVLASLFGAEYAAYKGRVRRWA